MVRDRHGDQHTVYELEERRFLRKVKRWKLDNGQSLTFDGALFETPDGDKLIPIGVKQRSALDQRQVRSQA